MVREKKGSVKISELDSNNRDADRDSSDESDIDESSDSLRPFEILSMHSCPHTVALRAFFCLFPSLSHSSVRILFSLPHFARPASRKTELQKNYLSALSALRNTRVFSRFTRKFNRELMVVNFPSADWLSDLRTQLKAFVGGVCLRSRKFFLALFSRINFFT